MGASVSKNVKTAEIECPMHRNGLERLRLALDGFMCKVRGQHPQIGSPCNAKIGSTIENRFFLYLLHSIRFPPYTIFPEGSGRASPHGQRDGNDTTSGYDS